MTNIYKNDLLLFKLFSPHEHFFINYVHDPDLFCMGKSTQLVSSPPNHPMTVSDKENEPAFIFLSSHMPTLLFPFLIYPLSLYFHLWRLLKESFLVFELTAGGLLNLVLIKRQAPNM